MSETLTPKEVELFIQLAEASSDDPAVVQLIVTALEEARKPLVFAMEAIASQLKPEPGLTQENLAEMAAIATALDQSGEASLMKQAEVLDEILLTIGAQQAQIAALKNAQDVEVARIKQRSKENKEYDPYTMAKEQHDKQNRVTESKKMISDKIKDYRPMEAPLNTRTCPDHPGAQMSRIAEHTYQCSMDKAVFNYQAGYTTMKGSKVPGGDVSNQTQSWMDRPTEQLSFDTRESKLNG